MAERKLEVKILGDSRSLERALGRSAGATRRFGKESKLGAVGMGLMAGAAAGATVAIGAGLSKALRTGISEFQGQARASAQTAAALKSTGGAAGVTQKHIEGVAAALQSQTGLADDAVQGAQNLLLTFTKISNAGPDKIFDRATKASADLSVALGKDLNGSAMMVGKALNDPLKGVTALGRAGVQFTKGQKETIKSLVETGRVAEAQKMILRELETQVGGSARAFGDSAPGKLAKAQRSFENLTESVVGSLMPAFEALLPLVTRGMQSIAPVIETVAKSFSDLVVQIAKSSEFQSIAQAFREIAVAGVQVLSAALKVAIPLVLAIVAPIASLAAALTRSSFAMGVLTAAFASFIALRVVSHITAAAGAIRTLATASAASVGITSLSNSFRMLTLGMTSVSAQAAGLAPGLTAAAGGLSRASIAASTGRAAFGNLGRAISGALGGPVGIAVTAGATIATVIGGDLVRSFLNAKDPAERYADAMNEAAGATVAAKDSLSGLSAAMIGVGDAQDRTRESTKNRVIAEKELRTLVAEGVKSGPRYEEAVRRVSSARRDEARAMGEQTTAQDTLKAKQTEVRGVLTSLVGGLSGAANAQRSLAAGMQLGVRAGTVSKEAYAAFLGTVNTKIMGSQELTNFRARAAEMAGTFRAEGTPQSLAMARALDGISKARTPDAVRTYATEIVRLMGGSKADVERITRQINRSMGKVGSVSPSTTWFDAVMGQIGSAASALATFLTNWGNAPSGKPGAREGSRENSSGGRGPNAMSFFYSQRSAAAAAGSGLSGMARDGFISRDPEAQAINARRKARQQDLNALQQRELEARVASAETADERRRAEIDLAEFLDALAWERVETDADAHARSIDDLASQFARGEISAEAYQTRLAELVGGDTGASNGKLFGEAWVAAFELALGSNSALQAIIANALGGQTGAQPIGGPEPESAPDPKNAQGMTYDQWRKKRGDFIRALEEIRKGTGGFTTAEKRAFRMKWGAITLAEWETKNSDPRRLASGGILRRAVLAGEAGPEAVIPLTGTRGRDYMARVMTDVMRQGSRGAAVVVNVAGNEFSAEEFARKIGPELRRQIALTGSY